MTNKTCKKCLLKDNEISQLKINLQRAINEVTRINSINAPEQTDLDTELRPIIPSENTITEQLLWTYIGFTLICGLFIGCFLTMAAVS